MRTPMRLKLVLVVGVTVGMLVLAGPAMASFGPQLFAIAATNQNGSPDVQAGSHPYAVTATFLLNGGVRIPGVTNRYLAQGNIKDAIVELPPGFVGNPNATPKCNQQAFLKDLVYHNGGCPNDTAVGVATAYVESNTKTDYFVRGDQPVYNMDPPVGVAAEFAFVAKETEPVYLYVSVRSGGDYGLTVSSPNLTQSVAVLGSKVTIWGVPAAPSHDGRRGECLGVAEEPFEEGEPTGGGVTGFTGEEAEQESSFLGSTVPGCSVNIPEVPLLTNPTSCGVSRMATLRVDSWEEPEVFDTMTASMPELTGCEKLDFSPTITASPDGTGGSTPTGLSVDLHVPQESTENPVGLAEADVKNATVALPEGVQVSPAAADGLQACTPAEIGLHTAQKPTCPEASKVANIEAKTPLLPEPLTGAVYLATQDENPFGSLIALYVVAEDPVAGVLIKVAGQVSLNPITGQLVTTFPNTPQLPYSDFKLDFFGTDRAPLSTPALCGTYTTEASLEPWSGTPAMKPSSKFQITSGPNGAPCSSPRPFQPGFEAGTTNIQAGAYSTLTMTMTRPDADETLGKLDVVFPPGISAGLQNVKLCEEPQAASGECPAASQIGQVTASAGLGNDPYSVEDGKAYITGPYEGAPFGVDVVVPAVAGPFNLGTEVVRSKVEVDPTTAQLTVVSDPFPTILDGIPLQLQHINVTVNRPGFVFNPTSCEPMKLTGQLESSEGSTANVSSPFQVTNCGSLSFKPEFQVSTEAKTSRTEGATLHVKLTLPSGAQGTKANVKEVKVSLPKQLPSPLKTLQKACTEKVFAENPSNCPVASRVGEAHVTTPVLEGGLKGPAYFVSHGGAKYPELIMVLTGEDGVTVQVHGETFISKQGITTATFATVPDVPFATFELELPKREYPALSANGNLCQAQAAGKLLMPTEMIGQNGDKINQNTKISVTGCPKVKKVTHKKKGKHAHVKRNRTSKKKG
ncbi:MAG: hypothetical protein ABSH36_04565 [Solirubrobacteraceae bacterium]